MDRQRPPEMDITAPKLTAFIFQEANRRHWYKRLSALSKELRHVDYKFARVSKGYPLDARPKLRLARAIAMAEIVAKYPATPEKWDAICEEYVADGFAIEVLDEVLDLLAEEDIHLVPRDLETGPIEDIPIAKFASGEAQPRLGSAKQLLAKVGTCFLGAFCGVIVGNMLSEPTAWPQNAAHPDIDGLSKQTLPPIPHLERRTIPDASAPVVPQYLPQNWQKLMDEARPADPIAENGI